ncbi:hypothetical protein Agub_g15740 [Astrephomene gubernaculifera]|uniref:U-box domain-containing protein n=1 Tax=Astrephomene gubernaculifera TaxID=47775 RepID=A0AAD3E3H6_9CHLO|nr:hypothetical protein Agub_g15740 [Astrephomene gubernaculifera]
MADPGESQASEGHAQNSSVNLVDLFQTGENCIERRRTDNLFKQLDERQLTEDEQAIIQQRVELQRKMFMEYERREKQRKVRELQEVCPDLDEEAATRALELCNWKEEAAAERVSSDPAFLRRVKAGGAAAAPEHHAPERPRTERQRSGGSRAAVGPRPKAVDPSQVGAVFVGRFKSRLGPHQISAMGRQPQPQPQQQQGAGASRAAAAGRRGNQAGNAGGDGSGASPALAAAATTPQQQEQGTAAAGADQAAAVPAAAIAAADVAATPPPRRSSRRATATQAATESQQQEKDPMDTEMLDAGAPDAAVERGVEGGDPLTDAAIGDGDEDGEEGGGMEEDEMALDPNSADLSDNELQYEDDVLPVLSPLAEAAKKLQQRQQQLAEEEEEEEGHVPAGLASQGVAGGMTAAVPGQSPLFRYRLVAEGSSGNVHSVATEEWNSLLRAQEGATQGQEQPQLQQHPQPLAAAAADVAPAGDDDEVSSPPTADRPSKLQRSGSQQKQPAAASQPQSQPASVATGPSSQPISSQQQPQQPDQASQPSSTQPSQQQPASQQLTATGRGVSLRPRRATAEQAAAAVRQAISEEGADEEEETASDGGDSDFEADGGKKGQQQRSNGVAMEASDSDDDSDDEDLVEEEEEEDYVAPGSRKRRAGAASSRQQPRKRGTTATAAAAARASRGGKQQPPAAAPFAPAVAEQHDNVASVTVAASVSAMAAAAAAAAAAALARTAAATAAPLQLSHAGDDDVAAAANGGGGSDTAAGPSCVATTVAAAAAAVPAVSGGGGEDSEATVTEDESSPGGGGGGRSRTARQRQSKGSKKGKAGGRGSSKASGGAAGAAASAAAAGGAAISASGHTCRGRVKQKGVKRADLLAVGSLVARPGWYNAGYIFPAGFKSQTCFRSSVDLDALTVHTCEVLGESGQYWPAPTFVVTAADRPDEPLVAKSCTGCWTAVLKRINGEIEGRRAAGEPLPPPPKTAIAGPEYFGLNQPEICAAIEALDVERKCSTYWEGKMDREAARGGQAVPARGSRGGAGGDAVAGAAGGGAGTSSRAPRAPRAAGGGGRGRRGRRGSNADEESGGERAGGEEEDPEETYAGNRWSAVTRAERYRKRCEDAGEDAAALLSAAQADNPLPGFLDPITLEPVVNPGISPYGHVMGMATWKAVLAEHGRCPFTKQPLNAEAITVLTKNNIERYRSRIIQQ